VGFLGSELNLVFQFGRHELITPVPMFAGTSSSELDALISANPRTKEDFQDFSTRIIEFIVKRHQTKPLYASFVEHHVRELCQPLKDVEIRKAASGLTTLANEKQKEQRDKTSGKKKVKAATKPVLGSAKVANK
jgi:translation initiation factor 3 subunit J